MSNAEQAPQGPETSPEVSQASQERAAELLENNENGSEQSIENGEKAVEKAKVEALENAISVEKGGGEKVRKGPGTGTTPSKRKGAISKKERDVSFKKEMQRVQSQLPAPKRAFSKFIHAKPIEKTSEVVGATVARPNAILSGAIVAFVAVLVVYLVAKNLGYVLSGFETIGAFIIGWVIGVLYDYFRVMITGKKS